MCEMDILETGICVSPLSPEDLARIDGLLLHTRNITRDFNLKFYGFDIYPDFERRIYGRLNTPQSGSVSKTLENS